MNKQTFLTLLATFALLFSFTFSCHAKGKDKAKHVVFIGLDGWGAYTLKKRSALPSSSAINWASMFMGAGPELHGYTEWGSKTPELPSRVLNKNGIFPTVFQLLRDARPEAEIGCLYEWEGIKYLVDTLSLSYHYHVADCNKTPKELGNMASSYIKEKHPALVAICYDGPDHTGHTAGHDTPEYYEKLKELDMYVGQIVQAVKDAGMLDDTIFILTSDHGGIDKGHGGKTMQEMETAFIISGKNIKKGLRFDDVSMMQYDVASTIARIFHLEQPQVWIGRPMEIVFK